MESHDGLESTIVDQNERRELLNQNDEINVENTTNKKVSFSDYPVSFRYILVSEICERYSFYAIRSILILFLIEYQGYYEDTSTSILHTFNSIAYLFPLLGSYLADSKLGKYKTLLYFGMIYSLGCIFLTISSIDGITGDGVGNRSPWGIIIGLGLISLGTGGIKPVVSTFCGDQLNNDQGYLLESMFQIFYWCINLGSLLSTFLSPLFRRYISYWFAFGLPAILLISSTIVLWMGRKKYIQRPTTDSLLIKAIGVIYVGLREKIKSKRSKISRSADQSEITHWLDYAKSEYDSQLVDSFKAAFNVLFIFLPLPFFWSLYDQSSTRWLLQARSMKLTFGKLEIQPDQIQSLNPLIVMAFIPIIEYGIYRPIRRRGINFKPLVKMALGMTLAVGSFVLSLFLQLLIDQNEPNSVPVFLQIPQYLVIAIGEIFLSITGLEFAYSQAPSNMKSIIMSGWLLCVSLGNIFVVVVVDGINFALQWHEFLFFASCMALFTLIFVGIAKNYKPTDSSISKYNEEPQSEDYYDKEEILSKQIILNNTKNGKYQKLYE